MQRVLKRVSEPSTWRGLILLLSAVGISFSPEMADHIVNVGLGLAGLVGVFTSDRE